jgi:hypothetical protein
VADCVWGVDVAHDKCTCHLPLLAPRGGTSWQPARDPEPTSVSTVVRVGDDPVLRRAVRVPSGWMERGVMVDGTGRPAVIPWSQVGYCWFGRSHLVIESK